MTDDLINSTINNYKIVRLIGVGGMGQVYEASHLLMDRRAAIKILRQLDQSTYKRFERECRALSAVKNSATPELYSWGVTPDGKPYLAMEYIDGQDLEDLLGAQPGSVLPADAVRSIAIGICDGLTVIHAAGLVHRDLKPSNIMVKETDAGFHVMIMDLGIAYAVAPGSNIAATNSIVGSVAYMSPEHYSPQTLDARSDLFSLGCIMYRALMGHAPFEADSLPESMMLLKLNRKPPVPDTVPRYLSSAIERCLAPDPGSRVQSATDLRRALRDQQELTAPLATVTDTKQRRVAPLIAIGAAATICAITGGLILGQHREDQQPVTIQDRPMEAAIWNETVNYGSSIQRLEHVKQKYPFADAVLTLSYAAELLEAQGSVNEEIDARRRLAQFLEDRNDIVGSNRELAIVLPRVEHVFRSNHQTVAATYVQQGRVLRKLGKLENARKYLQKAVSFYEKEGTGDRFSEGEAHFNLGLTLERSQPKLAAHHLATAARMYLLMEHPDYEKLALEHLIKIDRQPRYEEALKFARARSRIAVLAQQYERPEKILQADSPEIAEMIALANLVWDQPRSNFRNQTLQVLCAQIGIAFTRAGRIAASKRWFQRGFELAETLPDADQRMNCMVAHTHGVCVAAPEQSVPMFKAAIALSNNLANPQENTMKLLVADCASLVEHGVAGASQLADSLQERFTRIAQDKRQSNFNRIAAASHLGEIQRATRDAAAGIPLFKQVLSECAQPDIDAAKVANLWHTLGLAYEVKGERDKMLECYQNAYDLCRSVENSHAKSVAAAYLGQKETERVHTRAQGMQKLLESRAHALIYLGESHTKLQLFQAMETVDFSTYTLMQEYKKVGEIEKALSLCGEERKIWIKHSRRSTVAPLILQLESECKKELAAQ